MEHNVFRFPTQQPKKVKPPQTLLGLFILAMSGAWVVVVMIAIYRFFAAR